MSGAGLQWERIATVRTVLLIVVGVGALVAAAWLVALPLGLAALGVGCLFLEFMTGERPSEQGRRP